MTQLFKKDCLTAPLLFAQAEKDAEVGYESLDSPDVAAAAEACRWRESQVRRGVRQACRQSQRGLGGGRRRVVQELDDMTACIPIR